MASLCDSNGTTTTSQRNHILATVPKEYANARVAFEEWETNPKGSLRSMIRKTSTAQWPFRIGDSPHSTQT